MTTGVGVFDSSPLISLHQSDTLWLPEALFARILVPPAVVREVSVSPGRLPDRFEIHTPRVRLIPAESLGPGEREAIGLAMQIAADVLVLDDRPARRAAIARGLPVIGTFGLLLKAKRQGLISAIAPIMSTMVEAGHYASPGLQAAVLQEAGEI